MSMMKKMMMSSTTRAISAITRRSMSTMPSARPLSSSVYNFNFDQFCCDPRSTTLRWKSSVAMGNSNHVPSSKGDISNENGMNAAQKPPNGLNPPPDFNDAKAAYASKTTPELLRAAACFSLCKVHPIVNNAEFLLNVSRKILGGTITDAALRVTMFGHFCAGEDEQKIKPVLNKLDEVGIGSILDYAAESDGVPETPAHDRIEGSLAMTHKVREYDYESEAQCDAHVKTFQKCIQDVANLGTKDGYAAIKVTALGNPKLLARMSQAIVEAKRLFTQFDVNNDGYVNREEFETAYNTFFSDADIGAKEMIEKLDPDHTDKVDYITWSMNLDPKDLPQITSRCREVGPLALATPTEEEIELIEKMFERGHILAECAAEHGTRLLIDAEQVRYQPAIDNFVLGLQQKFNSTKVTDIPVIYNTYQCYLTDSTERLHTDVERAERFDYHFGAKLVRGAYMESERELAETLGIPSPIHETIQDTHDCYNDNVAYLLEKASKSSDRRIELMCATHNQGSIEKAIAAMNKYEVDRRNSIICFGQLYGMSDNLSFNLGSHGYRAYKYVPYGQVHEVMPYLLRRARENSSIAGGAAAELKMINNELRRRMKSAVGM